MIDTVVIKCELSKDAYEHIRGYMSRKQAVNQATGLVEYMLYAGQPPVGLATAQVTIKLQAWQVQKGSKIPVMAILDKPQLIVEGSIHKAMLGHNIYGGPRRIQASLLWYLHELAETYETGLPELHEWMVTRIDVAETYDLGCEDNVSAWINARKLARYPRRNVRFFADSGLEAAGSTTTLRAYAKGREHFQSGGHAKAKRLCREEADSLADTARRYLRCELQVNREKLFSLYDNGPRGTMVRERDIYGLFDDEWGKFLVDAKVDSPVLRASVDVCAKLEATYEPGMAMQLYLIWMCLATRGEDWYRSRVPSSTVRRQTKMLKDCYISWFGTDLVEADCPIADFVPRMDSCRRVIGTHPKVEENMLRYA